MAANEGILGPPRETDVAAGPERDLPVRKIKRRSGWGLVDLEELWRFRELLYFLVWRDVKVRYKQTVVGVAWSVLQPLATMAAFTLFLGRVASASGDSGALPYSLFVLGGLLPWTFFANAVSGAGNSVVSNERLVTKVYFPRLLLPLSAAAAGVLDFLIALAVLLVLTPFFGTVPGWGFWALPLVMAVLLCLAAGLGVLLAGLTVRYRDFRIVVPLVLQLWMFATPAIFLQDLSVLGPRTQALLLLNPMHGIVVNFRAAALDGTFDLAALGVTVLWTLAALATACTYFRRAERSFADVI
jgi:lipopolysaccharide transport system permease protein